MLPPILFTDLLVPMEECKLISSPNSTWRDSGKDEVDLLLHDPFAPRRDEPHGEFDRTILLHLYRF